MRCDEAQRALSEQRYAGYAPSAADVTPALHAHLAECAACRALSAQHAELDRMLALDEPVAPRPGFDTRFFARLAEQKAQPALRRRRVTWWLLPLGAAAVSMLLLRAPRAPAPAAAPPISADIVADVREVPPDDIALAMDLELVEDLDVVKQLDAVEDYDVLSQLDEDEIEHLVREGK